MQNPFHKVRRSDRSIEDEGWIQDFLNKGKFGVVAMSSNNQPFTNTNLFVYDEPTNGIYFHTTTQGHTFETIKQNSQVCFTTSEMGRLLPAEEAREFSVEYASVVVVGSVEILTDTEQRIYGLQKLLDKYFPHLKPGRDYAKLNQDSMKDTAVYKLSIESWSAKLKQAPLDFPGAFEFPF